MKSINTKKFDPQNWNWFAFLDASEEVKVDFKEKAEALSGSWTTCACGQLCDSLPRSELFGFPLDPELHRLGTLFDYQISFKLWTGAKQTLIKIEERSTLLLSQL